MELRRDSDATRRAETVRARVPKHSQARAEGIAQMTHPHKVMHEEGGVTPERSALPDWPRLMAAPLAAAYVGLSENTLRAVGPKPREVGRRRLYDRADLDRWADRLGGQELTVHERKLETAEIERRFLERRHARG